MDIPANLPYDHAPSWERPGPWPESPRPEIHRPRALLALEWRDCHTAVTRTVTAMVTVTVRPFKFKYKIRLYLHKVAGVENIGGHGALDNLLEVTIRRRL